MKTFNPPIVPLLLVTLGIASIVLSTKYSTHLENELDKVIVEVKAEQVKASTKGVQYQEEIDQLNEKVAAKKAENKSSLTAAAKNIKLVEDAIAENTTARNDLDAYINQLEENMKGAVRSVDLYTYPKDETKGWIGFEEDPSTFSPEKAQINEKQMGQAVSEVEDYVDIVTNEVQYTDGKAMVIRKAIERALQYVLTYSLPDKNKLDTARTIRDNIIEHGVTYKDGEYPYYIRLYSTDEGKYTHKVGIGSVQYDTVMHTNFSGQKELPGDMSKELDAYR